MVRPANHRWNIPPSLLSGKFDLVCTYFILNPFIVSVITTFHPQPSTMSKVSQDNKAEDFSIKMNKKC